MAWKSWRAARRRRSNEVLERPQYGWIWKPLLTLLGLYLVVTVGLGIWWSQAPAPFDVEQATLERRGEAALEPAGRGAVTTATLAATVVTLLDKPGGYLRNDIAPPGLWLDNMPHWELGVLNQARDLARALPGMTAASPDALEVAAERLMGDDRDWVYPSTEQRLEEAVEALDAYLATLGEPDPAGLVAGQGLAPWLAGVADRLDDLGLRLSASVGQRGALRGLDVDADALPPRTPWHRVDDIFFEARGTGWGLLHLLEGVHRDQADVLAEAGADAAWERLVAELAMTQRRLWSPLVLNGSGFGPFANHSLVMAHHVIRARDAASALAERLGALPTPPAAPNEAPQAPVEPPVVEVEQSDDADVTPPPEALAEPGAAPEALVDEMAEEAATPGDETMNAREEEEQAEEAAAPDEGAESDAAAQEGAPPGDEADDSAA
ncbi:DUF2333 family protein [Halomonas sp. 3H]|uniref:DUF2333 family protein n=1 Tax=Halomonas sp. 3H TaxID=2952527 RepID=UPI0020B838C5|nr:DUF2333 family protein [Halomonas sp. 3H]